ncbi:MAG: PKD domain-containing protein [Gemmatimonadales bacterium]
MRSIPLMAATTVILAAAWACGGDGGGTGPNNDPVANFTGGPCTVAVACSFADLSSDPEGDNTITTRHWDFGDGTTVDNPGANPSHTYTTAGNPTVTLTVTDNGGKSNTKSIPVTVTGGTTTNTPPAAGFVVPSTCTVNAACSFTDASTDSDGTIASWSWNFGDGTAADVNQNPTHTFAAASTYQVALTVTDNGGATNTITQGVTVNSAPQSGNCTVAGTDVTCELGITQASTVTLTLTSSSCQLAGNNVVILQPYSQNAFFNACALGSGTTYTLKDAAGGALVVQPGNLRIRLHQGTASVGSPTPGAPAGKMDGGYPNWTINFDDGGTPGIPGEPDFNDVVLSVKATPQ